MGTEEYPLWSNCLTERQQQQIKFARLYRRDFSHGANGHNDMVIIAELSTMLNQIYDAVFETDNNEDLGATVQDIWNSWIVDG